jgi:hypothetical protein
MIQGKYVIPAFLLLVSLLAAAQTVQSQQYATTTLTTLVTNSQASTVTVGTQVMTTTAGQSTPVFSGTVTVPGTHGVCGIYFVQAFNGTTGQILIGSVTASSAVDVYLMTSAAFQAWSHQIVAGGNCTPPSLVASQKGITSYNFTATLPSNGAYDLIVNNLSHSTVTAQVNANLAGSAPSLVTMVAYSTLTQQMVQTMMQTSTQTMQSTSGAPLDVTTLAVVVLVVVIVVAVAFLARAKRGKTGKK